MVTVRLFKEIAPPAPTTLKDVQDSGPVHVSDEVPTVCKGFDPEPYSNCPDANEIPPVPPFGTVKVEESESDPRERLPAVSVPMLAFVAKRLVEEAVVA